MGRQEDAGGCRRSRRMQEEQDVFPSAEGCVITGFPAMCPLLFIKAWLQILP